MASLLHRIDLHDPRTRKHNARFHAMVRDIARQVPWAGEILNEEDWKRLFLAAKFGQKVVPNPITGRGFVLMNDRRSSALTNEQMEELIGEIEAFGAERGITWSKRDDD